MTLFKFVINQCYSTVLVLWYCSISKSLTGSVGLLKGLNYGTGLIIDDPAIGFYRLFQILFLSKNQIDYTIKRILSFIKKIYLKNFY